jgi:Protein of unknown function (DUF4238)
LARSHKGQHWIPKSYLRAWIDPQVPAGQTPYVNLFSRDGKIVKRKSPSNIFKESDLYTIDLTSSGRDLRLEHNLGRLEAEFALLRDGVMTKRHKITDDGLITLSIFAAAMHVRTPMMRDHHSRFWHDVLDLYEIYTRNVEPQKVRTEAASYGSERQGMSLEQVQRMVDQTLQCMLLPFIRAEAKSLSGMQLLILCTDNDPGFITSDAPVVWYDPDGNGNGCVRRSPSFRDPKLEISVPVSPSQSLLFSHGRRQVCYVDVQDDAVVEINARTRFHCNNHFVVRRAYLERSWFDGEDEPLGVPTAER